MRKTKSILVWVAISVGSLLSLYALYVEHQATSSREYEALCDISETVSCSKVFLSEYGKIFSFVGLVEKDSVMDLPNAFYGLCFYVACGIVHCCFGDTSMGQIILLFLTTISLAMCAALSYVLAVILRDKCIVCFLTYLCNFTLFLSVAIK
jgi:vitamin-K-epoxide reductase (warfarin-sensitive)